MKSSKKSSSFLLRITKCANWMSAIFEDDQRSTKCECQQHSSKELRISGKYAELGSFLLRFVYPAVSKSQFNIFHSTNVSDISMSIGIWRRTNLARKRKILHENLKSPNVTTKTSWISSINTYGGSMALWDQHWVVQPTAAGDNAVNKSLNKSRKKSNGSSSCQNSFKPQAILYF